MSKENPCPIVSKYESNEFLRSNDIHHLKRKDGSITEARFVSKIPYKKSEYIVVQDQSNDCFGVYIILQIKKNNNKVYYSPIEDEKTLITLSQKFNQQRKLDDEEVVFIHAIESAKKKGFEFDMNSDIRY